MFQTTNQLLAFQLDEIELALVANWPNSEITTFYIAASITSHITNGHPTPVPKLNVV